VDAFIALEDRFGAHNYHPLPVVLAHGEGAWVTDTEGRRYLDLLAAYSAANFGHRHPRLLAAAHEQLDRLTLTSRAFHNDQLGGFCAELSALTGKDAVLPMNSGAEGVETAIKAARKWGYDVKGVRPDRAHIVVFDRNFHGRTTTIVSFSTDAAAKDGYGPYTPGFTVVPYGEPDALAAALTEDTVAVLVEPIQGEAGVIVPPRGWLAEVRRLCTERNVLMIADEIQSGLGRTGRTFACEHAGVVPDVYVLGKALGGGILPLSAIAADRAVMDVFHPGEHGSTFGGNPLACRIGREVVAMLADGSWQRRADDLGGRLLDGLRALDPAKVKEVRGLGLWAGIDLAPGMPPARTICERLLTAGLLCKETHDTTIRLSPPLVITEEEIDQVVETIGRALAEA
jgi:ornithine--oxo-acid transaminase